DSGNIAECDTIDLSIHSSENSDTREGPYYILAFEVGGVSTSSFIGVNADSLRWQVNHPAGSWLVLSLVDAHGNSGGVLPKLFTVQKNGSNADSSCLHSPPACRSYPEISLNVSDEPGACTSWSISVTSGVPPYTISFASLGSSEVFNYSVVAQEENSFSAINSPALKGKGQVLGEFAQSVFERGDI
ncbi:hypothetical protein BJ138DRAFT_999013, partial [Hygrophoropsis aurantiaca]